MSFRRINLAGAYPISLPRGELIVIEAGARYNWSLVGSSNRLAGLVLESRRKCNLFYEEYGVWYCGEYQGGIDEVPRLTVKDAASEQERREREDAKMSWFRQTTGSTSGDGEVRRPPVWGAGDTALGFQSFPVGPASGNTTAQQGIPVGYNAQFPQASPSHYPNANSDIWARNTPSSSHSPHSPQPGFFSGYDGPGPLMNMRQEQHRFPSAFPAAASTQLPSFPFSQTPMPSPMGPEFPGHTHDRAHPAWSSEGQKHVYNMNWQY